MSTVKDILNRELQKINDPELLRAIVIDLSGLLLKDVKHISLKLSLLKKKMEDGEKDEKVMCYIRFLTILMSLMLGQKSIKK